MLEDSHVWVGLAPADVVEPSSKSRGMLEDSHVWVGLAPADVVLPRSKICGRQRFFCFEQYGRTTSTLTPKIAIQPLAAKRSNIQQRSGPASYLHHNIFPAAR